MTEESEEVCNLYIGNLSYKSMEEDLEQLVKPFGEVVSSRIVRDRRTLRHRGFGFVEVKGRESAEKAIKELHGSFYMERNISVNLSTKQSGSDAS